MGGKLLYAHFFPFFYPKDFIYLLGLLNLFVAIISDKTEKRGLDAEKTREVIGLIAYLQKFEFIFGIKLSIVMYK